MKTHLEDWQAEARQVMQKAHIVVTRANMFIQRVYDAVVLDDYQQYHDAMVWLEENEIEV